MRSRGLAATTRQGDVRRCLQGGEGCMCVCMAKHQLNCTRKHNSTWHTSRTMKLDWPSEVKCKQKHAKLSLNELDWVRRPARGMYNLQGSAHYTLSVPPC